VEFRGIEWNSAESSGIAAESSGIAAESSGIAAESVESVRVPIVSLSSIKFDILNDSK
jgi:hypothetical protein